LDLIRNKIGRCLNGGDIVKFSTQVKPISYLKSHATEIAKVITENREPMLITQNGEARLVVMDVKSYEEQEQTLAMLKILALGSREIEHGKFRDVEQVFSELDQTDK
jgi:PHD/YefM family antitoxin component YafN of YafNO toxin-antitoxin module